MRAGTHRKIVGTLLMLHGVLYFGLVIYIAWVVYDVFRAALAGVDPLGNLGFTIAVIALILTGILYILQVVAGAMVLAGNSRKWGIFGSVAGATSGPVGILVAAYGLWFYFSKKWMSE